MIEKDSFLEITFLLEDLGLCLERDLGEAFLEIFWDCLESFFFLTVFLDFLLGEDFLLPNKLDNSPTIYTSF